MMENTGPAIKEIAGVNPAIKINIYLYINKWVLLYQKNRHQANGNH